MSCSIPLKTLLFALSLLAFSCSPPEKKLVLTVDEPGLIVNIWEFDRHMYESQMATRSDEKISASGGLAYVISNTYNANDATLDISNLKHKNQGYELVLETPNQQLARVKINDMLAQLAGATNHEVFYGEENSETFVLSVSNEALLRQHLYEPENGITSSRKRIGKSFSAKGKLSTLIELLNDDLLSLPLEADLPEGLSEDFFEIRMSWENGLEEVFGQLEKTYGLNIEKQLRSKKVLRIE